MKRETAARPQGSHALQPEGPNVGTAQSGMRKGVDERAMFENFVRTNGHIGPHHKIVAQNLGTDGDCWTAAWKHAQATGGTYVEGMCFLPTDLSKGYAKPRRVRAHAWVEHETPFGIRITECTDGYQDAYRYFGVSVDCSPNGVVTRASAAWTAERASIIEAFIVSGAPPAAILHHIEPR